MPNKCLPSKHRSTVAHEHPSTVRDTCCRSRVPEICCKCIGHLCYTWAYISVQEILDRNRATWAGSCPPHAPDHSCLPTRTLKLSGLAEHHGLLCPSAKLRTQSTHDNQARLRFQRKRLSWYCKSYHFIKGLAMFVVLTVWISGVIGIVWEL